jgi:glycosyltransferase involved in cell wall biosynthesis
MPDNPRLLFVENTVKFFITHRLALATACREAGFEVHVATPEGAEVADVLAAGFDFRPIRMSRQGSNPLREVHGVRTLVQLYRTLRPHLVHHLRMKPVLYGGIAARLTRIPAVVNTVTGLGFMFLTEGTGAAARRSFVKLALRQAFRHKNQRTIFQNSDDRREFVDAGVISEGKTVLIRGAGVDVEVFKPGAEPDGPPLVVLPSRMLWHKGVGEFVLAAQRLGASGVRARFALVGDTDPGNPVAIPSAQLEAWRASGVVEWWGWREDMPSVLGHAHVVCLPSYREGVPKALMEAAACGRAIVATEVPGCRDVVRNGQNGLLVPARDSKSLESALRALIESPSLRARFGARGREIAVREFSQAVIIRETLNVYRELMGNSWVSPVTPAYSQALES